VKKVKVSIKKLRHRHMGFMPFIITISISVYSIIWFSIHNSPHYRLILKTIFRLNTLAVTWQCLCLVWRRLWPPRSPWLFRKAKTSSCPTPSSKPNGSESTACYQKTSKTLSPTIVVLIIIFFTHPQNVFYNVRGMYANSTQGGFRECFPIKHI